MQQVRPQVEQHANAVQPDVAHVEALVLPHELVEPLVVHPRRGAHPHVDGDQHHPRRVDEHVPRPRQHRLRWHRREDGAEEEEDEGEPLPEPQRLAEDEPPDDTRGEDLALHEHLLRGRVHVLIVEHVQVVVHRIQHRRHGERCPLRDRAVHHRLPSEQKRALLSRQLNPTQHQLDRLGHQHHGGQRVCIAPVFRLGELRQDAQQRVASGAEGKQQDLHGGRGRRPHHAAGKLGGLCRPSLLAPT
mmetsp:Transcript_53613/g.150677  ORF Transcript_53613/g.150677 Transcript_53613/m.150677 type:complete len:245 (+) Transcript_53613:426-1160(+)